MDTAVVRVVDAGNSVVLEFGNLGRKDGSAAAAENANVTRAFFLQQVVHVFEVLNVPALVRGHGNGIGIFLNGCIHHFLHTAVVAEVDDFRPLDCRMRRMMLILASWPSNSDAAVTIRMLFIGT